MKKTLLVLAALCGTPVVAPAEEAPQGQMWCWEAGCDFTRNYMRYGLEWQNVDNWRPLYVEYMFRSQYQTYSSVYNRISGPLPDRGRDEPYDRLFWHVVKSCLIGTPICMEQTNRVRIPSQPCGPLF